MKSHSEHLSEFIQWAENLHLDDQKDQVLEKIKKAKTIYLLAPSSFIGQSFTLPIAEQLLNMGKRIILVDDTLTQVPASLPDSQVITVSALENENPREAFAINMANSVFAYGLFLTTAQRAGILTVDIIPVLDFFNMPAIYQTPGLMRKSTIERIDDYLALAHDMDDILSIQTLKAFLKMRITMNRDAVLPILCSLEDEYFSPHPIDRNISFKLSKNEIFCDIGAHTGTTIHKFLAATQWRYDAILAFEPDAMSYSSLKSGIFRNLPNFLPYNIALSNTEGEARFSETGTMGSRVNEDGNIRVKTSTLDSLVEHATFIKMDVEGHEVKVLQGAQKLIINSKPRLAITAYHFADDLLNIAHLIQEIEPQYKLRLRHHSFYYYDTIIYANIRE